MELEIILPKVTKLPLGDMLVAITEAIDACDPDLVAHGALGGFHGYGGEWSSPVFDMRPFYWGDCDCGFEARSEAWHSANQHADDCFRTELQRQFARYDEASGYNGIDAATSAPGMSVSRSSFDGIGTLHWTERTPAGDAAHKAWCKAHDERNKAHEQLTKELYAARGLADSPYQWHCSCGVEDAAKAYFATEGHYPTCALELPNFKHHATGMEVRWYKYIGRDMEATNAPVDLSPVLAECLADIAQGIPTEGGDGEAGSVHG